MDPINMLRLGQVIQQEMLERAALDQLDQYEWEPQPWLRRVGALLMSAAKTLTRAGSSAPLASSRCVAAPDITTECC